MHLANHKSELKRAVQNEVRRLRNKTVKTRVKSVIKDVRSAISEKSTEDAARKFEAAKSTIAKAARKGVIKKKTASRKISRLARHINKLSASPAE